MYMSLDIICHNCHKQVKNVSASEHTEQEVGVTQKMIKKTRHIIAICETPGCDTNYHISECQFKEI